MSTQNDYGFDMGNVEEIMEDYREFLEKQSEVDRALIEDANQLQCDASHYLGFEEGKKESNEYTRFNSPFVRDFEDIIETCSSELLDEYEKGRMEAMKYAGMAEILLSAGLSLEIVESIVANDMALKYSKNNATKEEQLLEEEASKF